MAAISSGIVPAGESGPGFLALSARMPEDLTGMDDGALLDIVRLSPRASGRRAAACELLICRHEGLVWSCARRYTSGPEPTEDLMQVGYVGLLKAISNFDPVSAAAWPRTRGRASAVSSSGISATSAGGSMSSARCRNWSWRSVRRPGG